MIGALVWQAINSEFISHFTGFYCFIYRVQNFMFFVALMATSHWNTGYNTITKVKQWPGHYLN